MQHLLLALSIISLTIIAGSGHRNTSLDNSGMIMKIEKPKVNIAEDDFPNERPIVYFSRFDMFVN